MRKYVEMNDFRGEGGNVDWISYNKAKINNGDVCFRCHKIQIRSTGEKSLCSQCRELESGDEVFHNKFVRCPKCGDTFDPYETEDYKLLYDGGHDVTCDNCDEEFEVTTYVDYEFKSPARKGSDDGED
jgi:hypothetical protein